MAPSLRNAYLPELLHELGQASQPLGIPHDQTLTRRDIDNPFDKSNPKPKTPVIAGTVCGGVVLIAWIIGFTIYFRKRYRRKKQKRKAEAGKAPPPETSTPTEEDRQVVVPPDPAILLGYRGLDSSKNPSKQGAPKASSEERSIP
jgi:hypothetical protein